MQPPSSPLNLTVNAKVEALLAMSLVFLVSLRLPSISPFLFVTVCHTLPLLYNKVGLTLSTPCFVCLKTGKCPSREGQRSLELLVSQPS